MTEADESTTRPWYKETWLWLVLAPLITVVIVSAILVTTAFNGADEVVKGKYHREGRMIYQDDSAETTARALHIQSDIDFDWQANMLIVQINREESISKLTLELLHPASALHDLVFNLRKRAPGMYVAALKKPPFERWSVRLVGRNQQDEVWRLEGKIDFSQSAQLHLE